MTREHLRYEVKDGVGTITLARPAVLNSLNTAMARELQAVLDEAAASAELRSSPRAAAPPTTANVARSSAYVAR